MSLEWSQEITDIGVIHVATFLDMQDAARTMVVTPVELDGKRWFSLEDSDPAVLDVGDDAVFFSEVNAAKDYAEQLRRVFMGLLPPEAGGINYSSTGQQEWSPLPQV